MPTTDSNLAVNECLGIADVIGSKRADVLRTAAHHGAHNVRVFGSVARGEAGPESDVDFLVEMDTNRSLMDLSGLKLDLQELLGRSVDVAEAPGLHHLIRSRVLREVLPLYRVPSLSILLMLILQSIACAATLNVPSTGYPTIQAAIDVAHSGDTILVADGKYTGPGDVDIGFLGKNLTVKSLHGAEKTIIDCGGRPSPDGSGDHRGFYIHGGETEAVICGFTITHGYKAYVYGVKSDGSGAGIDVLNSSVTIQNCIITGNAAQVGGGVSVDSSKSGIAVTLTNCAIDMNTATYGGGFSNGSPTSNAVVTLTNCTFSRNRASFGGGVDTYMGNSTGSLTLENCTMSGNIALQGGAIYEYQRTSKSIVALTNCILYGNSDKPSGNEIAGSKGITVNYCDVQGNYLGTGIISADPLFVRAPASTTVETGPGDLHLRMGSPCRSIGSADAAPKTDQDNTPRSQPPNIGAY